MAVARLGEGAARVETDGVNEGRRALGLNPAPAGGARLETEGVREDRRRDVLRLDEVCGRVAVRFEDALAVVATVATESRREEASGLAGSQPIEYP